MDAAAAKRFPRGGGARNRTGDAGGGSPSTGPLAVLSAPLRLPADGVTAPASPLERSTAVATAAATVASARPAPWRTMVSWAGGEEVTDCGEGWGATQVGTRGSDQRSGGSAVTEAAGAGASHERTRRRGLAARRARGRPHCPRTPSRHFTSMDPPSSREAPLLARAADAVAVGPRFGSLWPADLRAERDPQGCSCGASSHACPFPRMTATRQRQSVRSWGNRKPQRGSPGRAPHPPGGWTPHPVALTVVRNGRESHPRDPRAGAGRGRTSPAKTTAAQLKMTMQTRRKEKP